jgi:hypothetical protein
MEPVDTPEAPLQKSDCLNASAVLLKKVSSFAPTTLLYPQEASTFDAEY